MVLKPPLFLYKTVVGNLKKSSMLEYLKDKKNLPYFIMLIIGIIIATYKYDFLSALIGFGIIILFGIVMGLLIRLFIK
jgi:hypothetical protein